MKLKLRLPRPTEEAVREELEAMGVQVTEDASLILTEEGYQEGILRCQEGGETVVVPLSDICHIEALGKEVLVHTAKETYHTGLRLYQLDRLLPVDVFLRISNSVIIRRNAIRRVRPALSCKFTLTLTNGAVVDVTRTYYYKFKDFYGI